MTTSAKAIRARLHDLADPKIAAHSGRFFKTGRGEYGEGDRFLGIRVPVLRRLAREHRDVSQRAVLSLLRSAFHEERLLALLMMVDRFKRGTSGDKARIYAQYMGNMAHVNNWDLVDTSASDIVGAFLENGDKEPLYRLAESDNLWARRIAVIATFHYIKDNSFEHTLAICERLLADEEDLIHKAVGWALREVGNRDRKVEERFLRKHYRKMPRTMLRYAIEKFPEARRKGYLHGRL